MKDVVRKRISELEVDQKKYEKKLNNATDNAKKIEYLVEIEKIKASINNLYICLGRSE